MKKILLSVFVCLSFMFTAQITNGLLVHYELNGNANDATANQINGTISGAVASNDRNGNQNSSLSFDGVDDNVTLTNSSILKPQFPFTIAYWVKVDQLEAGLFYCSEYIDNEYFGFWSGITLAGEVHINFGDGGIAGSDSRQSKVSAQTLNVGVWHHVVCTVRGANDMDIFIDCQDAGGTYSGGGNSSMVYSNYSAKLFNTPVNGVLSSVFMKGSLDDLMIWNRELISSEINGFCQSNSVSSLEELTNLQIYSNPTNNVLKIELGNLEIDNVSLYNSEGKLVLSKNENFESIAMTNFENGVYFLKVQDKQLITKTFKVIKN